MFPLKPPDVPDDIWELEQPSILGLAHPGTPAAGGTPSPRSSASLISVDDSLSPNPDPTFDTEESTCLVPPTTEAQLPTSADTLFQEWNAAYYQTWLQLDASFIHGPTPSGSPTSEAERLAMELLRRDSISFEDLRRLLDMLPDKTAARRRDRLCDHLPGQKCFSSGAFTFAHSTGLQSNSEHYPRTTQLLTSILRGMNPESCIATVTMQRNVQIQMHRDLGNQPGTDNIIIPCSRWMGGCLWVRNDGGTHLLDPQSGPGTMVRIGLPYTCFAPHQPHATTPWSEGDRTILIGSTPRQLGRLTASQRQQLIDLGFRLPVEADGGHP